MAQILKRVDARGAGSRPNKRPKVSLYDSPPSGDVSLEEFEQFALDRMRVLKAIDTAKAKGTDHEELKTIINKACSQYLPLRGDSMNEEEDMRKDHISHFILRIAYSRTEDLRRWFLRQEEQLFKHRFNHVADAATRTHLMSVLSGKKEGETELKTIEREEWEENSRDLLTLFGNIPVGADGGLLKNVAQPYQHIFKVPFEEVTDLVATRKVFLSGGDAYVISRDVISVVISNFRLRLSRQLTENARNFFSKAEEESERLGPLLQNLTNAYLGADFSQAGAVVGRVTLDKIPIVMQRSAPMCMKALYNRMNSSPHHLKHDGRMQFGLFLKGIGVTLEDSIAWWRESMMKGGKTGEVFDKQYAYNIRHNYGQEGKRTNYTPYSCQKIIGSAPVGDQYHGCPYKHWDEKHLVDALNQMRLPSNVVHDVVDKVKGQHYQVACLKVFEATHPGGTSESLQHPNTYFQDSMRYYEDKEKKNEEKAAGGGAADKKPTVEGQAVKMDTA